MHVRQLHASAVGSLSAGQPGAAGPFLQRAGAPLRLYHGSRSDIARFSACYSQMDRGERGIYLTDCPVHANQYTGVDDGEAGGVIYPVHVQVSHPYVVTVEEWGRGVGLSPEQAHAHGYDAYVVRGQEGADTVIVFDGDLVSFAIGAEARDADVDESGEEPAVGMAP